jgi:hypothetical protein
MLTALRSRAARLLALIVALAAFLVAAIGAPAASALIAPDGQYAYPPNPALPAATSGGQVGSGSSLAIWLVVVIALAALGAGVVLAEFARSLTHNRRVRRPAVAAS